MSFNYRKVYEDSNVPVNILRDPRAIGDLPLALQTDDFDDGQLWLTNDQAINLANALLREAGVKSDEEGLIRASDLTYNEGALRLAAVHGKAVTFRYAKSTTAPIETREFVPESVIVTKAGDKVVLGPDADREHIRSFRLDRIKGDVEVAR